MNEQSKKQTELNSLGCAKRLKSDGASISSSGPMVTSVAVLSKSIMLFTNMASREVRADTPKILRISYVAFETFVFS